MYSAPCDKYRTVTIEYEQVCYSQKLFTIQCHSEKNDCASGLSTVAGCITDVTSVLFRAGGTFLNARGVAERDGIGLYFFVFHVRTVFLLFPTRRTKRTLSDLLK